MIALKMCLAEREKTGREALCDCYLFIFFCMFGYALQLHWSLSLSDHLIVALEDASLIQMNIDMSGPDMAVQGRRRAVLSPIKVRNLTQHNAT